MRMNAKDKFLGIKPGTRNMDPEQFYKEFE